MSDSANTFKSLQPMIKEKYGSCTKCKKKLAIRPPKMSSGSTKFTKIKNMFKE